MELDIYYESGSDLMGCQICDAVSLFPFEDLGEDFSWIVGNPNPGNVFPDIGTLTVSRY